MIINSNYIITIPVILLLIAKTYSNEFKVSSENPLNQTLSKEVKTNSKQPKNVKIQNAGLNRIAIIGASYVEGWNIQKIAEMTVVNKGISGEQSIEMRNRFAKDVVSLNPRAVIIWGMINDIFNANHEGIDTALEKTKDNFITMVKLAQDNGIIPILTTELTIRGKASWSETIANSIGKILGKKSYQDYVNKHVLAMNQWIRSYANDQNLLLLDLQHLLSDEQGLRKKEYAVADGSHISPYGYEKLTSYTQTKIEDYLAKSQGRQE